LHADLIKQVGHKLEVPAAFALVAHWGPSEDKQRKLAYQQMFESTVLTPALNRAAQKIKDGAKWTNEEGDALRQLLLLESDFEIDSAQYKQAPPTVTSLGRFIFTDKDEQTAFNDDEVTWERAFTWIYSKSPTEGQGQWRTGGLAPPGSAHRSTSQVGLGRSDRKRRFPPGRRMRASRSDEETR